MDDSYVFPGFPSWLDDGYTQFPNAWFDILQQIKNKAALKVILYVIRHTWGYRSEDGEREGLKWITLDEFTYGRKRRDGSRLDSGTNMSRSTVQEGLKYALKHGYLVCEADDTDMARERISYGLKLLNAENVTENRLADTRNSVSGDGKSVTGGGDSGYRSEKETPETNSQKETKERIPVALSPFSQKALQYIEKKGSITYYQLERFLHRFMRVRGKETLHLTRCKNLIAWDGVSPEYWDTLRELISSNQIDFIPGNEQMYEKGRRPRLPVAAAFSDYDEPHWRPMLIKFKRRE